MLLYKVLSYVLKSNENIYLYFHLFAYVLSNMFGVLIKCKLLN